MKICGYMVVRKPAAAYDPIGRGIWPKKPPSIGATLYGGAWRMPWYDVKSQLENREFPGKLRDLFLANISDAQGSGFALCKSIDLGIELLKYSNRGDQNNEIIAAYSPTLSVMKGTFGVDGDSLNHLGWEPFQIGGASLIVDGVFAAPERFPTWHVVLNRYGLLNSAEESFQYISDFQALAKTGLLEELFPAEQCPIEPVKLMSLRGGVT
jgi:hypothetical protein